jgi:hypothetical protein
MKRAFLPVVILTLAACGGPDPVAHDEQDAAALPPPANQQAPSPTGAPPASENGTSGEPAAIAAPIPATLQGRWGLTPGDCTSTRGDAKGLLIVEPDRLRFYESRALPSPGVQVEADSISGNFAFMGEGQEWTRYESLERQGDKLVRTEREPVATFTYVRC